MHSADYLELDGRLAFTEVWPGDRGAVVCIHTAGQSGAQYRWAAPGIAELGYSVIVMDLPGHGRSDPAADGPISDLSWYAQWTIRLLDAMSVTSPYVLGCSIGGSIALDIATRVPDRLAGAIALDPSGVLGPDGDKAPAPPLLEDAASPSMRDRTYFGTIQACGRSVPAEHAELMAQMHCREDWHITSSDIHGAITHDIRDALANITCPTYIVTGEEDYFIPVDRVRAISRLVPRARFEVLPGVGHYPIEEVPDFAARFAGWVSALEES